MTLEDVIDVNYRSIPGNLNNLIKKLGVENDKYPIEFSWEGFDFKFIFYLEDAILQHDIIINKHPKGIENQLIIDLNSRYLRNWGKHIEQESKIGSVSIARSGSTNNTFLKIDFKNSLKDVVLSVAELNCKLNINGAKKVIIDNLNSENIIIKEVDEVNIRKVWSSEQSSKLETENVRILNVSDSSLFTWTLTGKIFRSHVCKSKIKNLSIIETDFNQIEFNETTIDNCIVENVNLKGYFGQFRFNNSNIVSLLDLREVIVKGHGKSFFKFLKLFRNTEN